jgi:hypothetical protein
MTLYVYAVASRRPVPLGRGLQREPLRAVALRGAVAIVGEMGARPAPDPERLQAHDAAVSRLARRCPALLPARFGWIVATADALRAALLPHHRELDEALRLVRGCVQMNVRVLGDVAPTAAPVPPPTGTGERPGTRYLLARAEAWRAAAALPELDPLRSTVAPLLRAEKQERQGGGGIVGTAYHLIERTRVASYRARVARAADSLRPFRVHVTGPWAAYAFAPEGVS